MADKTTTFLLPFTSEYYKKLGLSETDVSMVGHFI